VTENLRVGVIGVNGIGQAHLFSLARSERSSAAAVCDIDAFRADRAAEQWKVPGFSETSALFASGAVDAVVVATPAGSHGGIVRDALDAGVHVYCEKPIAPTSDEGYALARHAEHAGRTLQVGFQFRFHTGYAAVRDAVAAIGPLSRVNLTATNWFRPQAYFDASPWRSTWSMAGGGVLMNQAVHQVDAMIATAGMPSSVRARIRRARHRAAVEDDAVAEPAGRERLEFFGTRGAVVLEDGYDVHMTVHDDAQELCDDCPDEFPELAMEWQRIDVARADSEWIDCLLEAHRDFAAAVLDGTSPSVDAVAGTRSVELANAIYLSSVEDRPVELPLERGAYRPCFEKLVAGDISI
jgi:predicted dehydrogenase